MIAANAAVMIAALLFRYMYGENDQYAHLLVNYHDGFLKRALIGEIVSLVFSPTVPIWLVYGLGTAAWLSGCQSHGGGVTELGADPIDDARRFVNGSWVLEFHEDGQGGAGPQTILLTVTWNYDGTMRMTRDQLVEAILGPTAARLNLRFSSVAEYLDFWRSHPAFARDWTPELERYLAYDLVSAGEEGLRPATAYATTPVTTSPAAIQRNTRRKNSATA